MSANGKSSKKPPFRRRQYVVDKEAQMGVATHLLAGLGMVVLIYASAMMVFLGDDAIASMSMVAVRQFLMVANGLYFLLAGVFLTVLTILLTHRFTGPAYVLDLALKGMKDGDYGRRLTLRERDYMKPVAQGLLDVRTQWVTFHEKVHRCLEEAQVHLEQGDVEAASEILESLRRERLVRPETVKPAPKTAEADAPAPSEQEQPAPSAAV